MQEKPRLVVLAAVCLAVVCLPDPAASQEESESAMWEVVALHRPADGCTANLQVERDGGTLYVCVEARTDIRWQGAPDSDEPLERADVGDIRVGSELELRTAHVSTAGEPTTFPVWGQAMWIRIRRDEGPGGARE